MKGWFLTATVIVLLGSIVKSIVEHAPDTATAQVAASAGTPSATVPPTVDALATDAASLAATAAVVSTMRSGTETQRIQGTVEARTATAEAWTATAIAGAATLRSAEITEAIARVDVLALTLTAAPARQTEDERQLWEAVMATRTQAVIVATVTTREREQADAVDVTAHWATVALIGVGTVIVLAGMVYVMVALSWRVQGVSGGQAQAEVEAVRRIPTDGGDGEPIVMDDERDALADFVDTCRRMSGDGSTTITPQSQFGSDAGWDGHVRKLAWLGLVKTRPGKGGGTLLTDGRTLAELSAVLRGQQA